MDVRIAPQRRRALKATSSLYDRHLSPQAIEEHQLARINLVWSMAIESSPFYRSWRQEHDLPLKIGSLAELGAFPVLTKRHLQLERESVFVGANPSMYYETGGSTGEPARFPRSRAEDAQRFADNFVGRSWWGLRPYERSVLVWGHSHLYGQGIRRWARIARRGLLDRAGGTLRLNGYSHADSQLHHQLRALIHHQPTYIVGYTSALVRLARIAKPEDREKLVALNLKAIVVTAETLDVHDEHLLRSTFNCPVVVEYGAAETGILAISRGTTRNLEVLWNSVHLAARNEEVLVTTLTQRQFPLINYELTDRIQASLETHSGSVLTIHSVEGRKADVVMIRATPAASRFSALQLTHMLKGHPSVEAVQFEQLPKHALRVHVRLSASGSIDTVRNHLELRIHREHPQIDLEAIEVVARPDQVHTKAGKHRLVLASDEGI